METKFGRHIVVPDAVKAAMTIREQRVYVATEAASFMASMGLDKQYLTEERLKYLFLGMEAGAVLYTPELYIGHLETWMHENGGGVPFEPRGGLSVIGPPAYTISLVKGATHIFAVGLTRPGRGEQDADSVADERTGIFWGYNWILPETEESIVEGEKIPFALVIGLQPLTQGGYSFRPSPKLYEPRDRDGNRVGPSRLAGFKRPPLIEGMTAQMMLDLGAPLEQARAFNESFQNRAPLPGDARESGNGASTAAKVLDTVGAYEES
jgi:hypothetical protein